MTPDPINMKGGAQGGASGDAQARGAKAAGAQTGGDQTGGAQASKNSEPFLDHANNPALSDKVRGYWKEIEAKYVIPRLVREKYHQLIELIKETESMNDEEREYWFQIMPIMTEDQLEKFVAILENEKNQLQKLDQEYEEEINKLNDKHQVEWNAFEAKEKREQLQEKEAAFEAKDAQKEDELLGKLGDL